jgi:serine protease Do
MTPRQHAPGSPTLLWTLLAAVLLSGFLTGAAAASERRMTPIVRAVQRARASAVNIHSEKTSQADTLFSTGKPRKVNGMGTGVLIDERGYIVTNHHVVKEVDSLRCTLADGSTYSARVVTFDAARDLAIIKIDPTGPLPTMPLGTSSDLMLGETVIAVGNAFGYEHTITCGIISALHRDVEVNETQSYQNLIQTDASINPGNSGGPLINVDGEVIGINVAIRAGAQRIGFAIPIDDARHVIAQMISVERLDGNWHGLVTRDIKDGAERRLEVRAAAPSSPAVKAGFQAGDTIRRVGSVAVVDGVDLERAILGRRPGEELAVVVDRAGSEQVLSLIVEARAAGPLPKPVEVHAAVDSGFMRQAWSQLGVRLVQAGVEQIGHAASRYRGGMKVTDVRPGSPADQNGIKQGDILVGLHIWETVNEENVVYVLEHPKLDTFNPLKFYILRGKDTLYGHLRLAGRE